MAKAWLKCADKDFDYVQVRHIRTLKRIADNTWHAQLDGYAVNVQATDQEIEAIVNGEDNGT